MNKTCVPKCPEMFGSDEKITSFNVNNHSCAWHKSRNNGFSHTMMWFCITSEHFWTFWNTCLIHTFLWTFYIKNNIFWRIAPLNARILCNQVFYSSRSEGSLPCRTLTYFNEGSVWTTTNLKWVWRFRFNAKF